MEYLFAHPEIMDQWKQHFYLRSITDAFGNVFATGNTDGHLFGQNRGNKDIFFAKCDIDGNFEEEHDQTSDH